MINVYAAIKHSVNLRYLHTPATNRPPSRHRPRPRFANFEFEITLPPSQGP